eukprot:COSAG05_NODE_23_length_31591_cov_92.542995_12_plen_785_part_00
MEVDGSVCPPHVAIAQLRSEMEQFRSEMSAKLDVVLAALNNTSECRNNAFPPKSKPSQWQPPTHDAMALVLGGGAAYQYTEEPQPEPEVAVSCAPAAATLGERREVEEGEPEEKGLSSTPSKLPKSQRTSIRLSSLPRNTPKIDSLQPFVHNEASFRAVQKVRQSTIWVGKLPYAALRGLGNHGSSVLYSMFAGLDVVAVSVRRKDDTEDQRKSWGLVTFDSAEAKDKVLASMEVKRPVQSLWKIGLKRGPEPTTKEDSTRKIPMTMPNGRTITLTVKDYQVPTTAKGASLEVLESHVAKATEACGTFAISVVASKTGRLVSINVQRLMRISDLKLLLHKECPDIMSGQMRLKLKGVELTDEQSIGQSGIFPGGERLEMQIKASLGTLCGMRNAERMDNLSTLRAMSEEDRQEMMEIEEQMQMHNRMRSNAVKGGYAVMSCVPGRRHFWFGMLLHPDGELRQRWDLLVASMVVVSVWLIPLTVAFQEELDAFELPLFLVLERCIDAAFMLHVILNFRTAIVDENMLVSDSRTIAVRYIRGWFLVDIVASVPFDFILNTDNSSSKATGSFRLARLLRLGRLVRVASIARMRMSSNSMRLLKLVFYLLTLAHWIGCTWYFISKIEQFPDDRFSAGSMPHMVRPSIHCNVQRRALLDLVRPYYACQVVCEAHVDYTPPHVTDGGSNHTSRHVVYDPNSSCEIVAAQFLLLYLFSFQWGLSNLAALGANLYPSTAAEAILSILIHGIGFYVTSCECCLFRPMLPIPLAGISPFLVAFSSVAAGTVGTL